MAEKETHLFRHKTIRRFRVGKYEFKNNEIRVSSDQLDDFLAHVEGLPERDQIQIVEINEAARAASERSIRSPVVRGPMSASDILTAKDKAALAAQGQKASTEPAGGTTPPKPTLDIAALNLGKK